MSKKKLYTLDELKNMKEKDISEKEIKTNTEDSKKRMIFMYFVPVILLIGVAVVYLITSIHWLLIPFAILLLITLFGWDGSDRVCPKCKKFNSVKWISTKNLVRKTTITKTNKVTKKAKNVEKKKNFRRVHGKCIHCGYDFEKDKNRLL